MNGGGIHWYCRVWEPPALDYSLPLPQGPSAMQLSCEPVLRRALLYPVNAQALQQCFPSSRHTHIQIYNDLNTHQILVNMLTVGRLTQTLLESKQNVHLPALQHLLLHAKDLQNVDLEKLFYCKVITHKKIFNKTTKTMSRFVIAFEPLYTQYFSFIKQTR